MADVDEKLQQYMSVRNVVMTSLIAAFGFVLALFWNDAIKSTIERFIPEGEGLYYKYFAALIVTAIVIITIYIIAHSTRLINGEATKRKQKRARPRGAA